MPEFKIVISDPQTGKSISKELKDKPAQILLGMKIGQEFDATVLGLNGTVKIRGGSDKVGFPMRSDVHGGVQKHILITDSVGFNTKQKGLKKRKLVRGNVITDEIYQVNTILTKGSLPKPEEKAESKPEEKAESKPEEKAESKPEEKAESKPEEKAESKPEEKAESKPEEKIQETSDTKTK